MLRYKTKTRPGLVALYDIRPGNGAGQFLQPWSPHGAVVGCVWEVEGRAGVSIVKRLAVAAACGSQPVAAALPNLTGERRVRHPGIVFAVHRSRLTHLSLLPFPVPFRPRRRPAGRRLTSRYSILPRLPGLALIRKLSVHMPV